jgi:uncharacterized membrane protein YfcA
MDLRTSAVVALAALLGGAVNAVAGGGTLVTFPVLVSLGLPPLEANATSTVGLLPGSWAAVWHERGRLASVAPLLPRMAAASLAGGLCGALLLEATGQRRFDRIVPWLVLAATVLFAFAPRPRPGGHLPAWGATALLFVVGVYGGYFGGGQGIVLLALLALSGGLALGHANVLKNLCAGAANLTAAVVFLAHGLVSPRMAAVAMAGSVAGGLLGARLGRKVGPARLRWLVIGAGLAAFVQMVR